MGRWRFGSLVVAMFVCCVSPAARAQPTDEQLRGGLHRVDATTGALVPLEGLMSRVQNAGASYYCYLPGATSTKAFPQGEPHAFVVVRFDSRKGLEKQLQDPNYRLEQLTVKDGKRYGTKVLVPLDVAAQGDIVEGMDPDKRKNRAMLTFRLTPKQPLPPGEYAFSYRGIVVPSTSAGGYEVYAEAFRIEPRAAVAQAPPRPTQQPPTTAAGAAPADMRQLREAAERGDSNAQSRLGYAYGTGTGVPQDYELAALWFRKAAAQGQMEAQYSLALMHKDGLGMPKNDAQAALLFQQAAEQGHAAAQVYLAEIYYRGRGLSVDWVEAHKWLNLAAARLTGDDQKQAAGFRDQVAAQLLPGQLAEAQKRAREWMEAFEKRRP